MRESLRFALRTPVAALSSAAPKLPPPPPAVSAHEGAPSVWTLFLLHGSLPLVQVPSLFFCLCFFFFLLPYPGMWGVSCLLGGLMSSASVQWVFCRSSSTCGCISTVSVGRKVISASYSSAILPPPPRIFFIHSSRRFERLAPEGWEPGSGVIDLLPMVSQHHWIYSESFQLYTCGTCKNANSF